MSEDIRWMQMSDLHIGSPNYRWTDKTLKERLHYFLTEGYIPHLQFIVITGDIINCGEMNNKDYVDELYEFLNIIVPFTDKIIITPGNHDYKRNNPRFKILEDWEDESDKKSVEDTYSRKLTVDFEECSKLFEGFKNIIFTLRSEIIKLDGINIVSINSSVFSGQPYAGDNCNIYDEGRLWICESDLPSFNKLNRANPTIMIGHHPFEMFDPKCIKLLETFSVTCGIKYYFCGHMHKMNTVTGVVTQLTSAGLFKDSYNRPSFAIYSIKKSANETLNKDYYVWNGDWERMNKEMEYENDKILGSQNIDTPFTIIPSEISDGAIRLPYANGKFNIYVSKEEPGTIIIPHKHYDIDEVTYVMKGSLLVVIDNMPHYLQEGTALLMPKGKYHSLIPDSYPCEYLTMSVEEKYKYDSDWQEDIITIREIDKILSTDKYSLEKYDEIIEFISSSVMEVRWEAEAVLNKRLVQQNNSDNDYIRDVVGTKIRPAIRSHDYDKQFFGLSVAYELGIDISNSDIIALLKSDNFMIAWVCAYYIIKLKKGIDLKKVYRNITGSKAYQRAIIAVLQLIVKHDNSLLEEFDDKLDSCLTLDDILMHFTVWCTSFTYNDQELDYSESMREFKKLFNEEGEQILRGFTNVHESIERFNQIKKCKGKMYEAACAYFKNIRLLNTEMSEEKTKDRVENYLRIIVSEDCNLNCVYCHHEGRIDSLIGADVKRNQNFDLRKLLLKAKELKFKKIKISGGEPLLYPNVLDICNEFDFEEIGFTTNGTQIGNLKDTLAKIDKSRLTFNVTLNSLKPEKNEIITGVSELQSTLDGIDCLIDEGFSLKINSVITSFNLDEVADLVSYAARQKISIKFLDLFVIENTPELFQHVSISEIKSEIMKKFRLKESDFIRENDYLTVEIMGIKVMIPSRVYSVDCQYNCKMYPCAEGIFGIRVYEDYSCAKCLSGTIYRGGLEDFNFNIAQVRKELNTMRFSF